MNSLEKYVYSFRKAIDKAKKEGLFYKDISFHSFPTGCCGDASDLLGHYLLEKGIPTRYVCGTYHGNNEWDDQSHAWLQYGDKTIIDISGDQFRFADEFYNFDNPVYIGPNNRFHRLFKSSKTERDTVYLQELGAICYPRLISLYNIIISELEEL